MNFISKTNYKLKLLFTNPKKLMNILFNILKTLFISDKNTSIDGIRYGTDTEVAVLKKYASESKIGIIEIGVLDGKTTKEMGKVANVPIYGIDPLIPDSENRRLIGHEKHIINNMAFYPRFIFLKDYSYNIVRNWQYKFDFIFIDGDHKYEAVKKDFIDWFPLLEHNGIIAFHDSAPVTSMPGSFEGWSGPTKLVNELRENRNLKHIETIDTLTIFKKL